MLGGDFTGFPTIYDPTTQTVERAVPFTVSPSDRSIGNGNKIPANMIDPVAAAITKYYPAPNIAGASGFSNNFFFNVPSSNPFTKYFRPARLANQSEQSLHRFGNESDNPAVFHNQGICPINCQNGDVSRDNAQVSWVWTISPTHDQRSPHGIHRPAELLPASLPRPGFSRETGHAIRQG